ncbi:MAG: pantetheine-phosphate adenylyltransferase [Bacteroidaceae bacterium]|nr:pantetheine-phosphate adenylyltransferase [Bacteroidaceae bacterium]
MPHTALFAGSFDPYTIGHHSLVERALQMFDKIVIAIGCNSEKGCCATVEERVATIAAYYKDNERVEVRAYNGLTMDFAREVGADVLLRGVRNIKDFEYERELADVNKQLGGIDTVLLVSEPGYSSVSSSVVRELMRYGKDVSKLLP